MEQIKPSQPQREIGRPSISRNSSTIVERSRSTVTSLSAHPCETVFPSLLTAYCNTIRESKTYSRFVIAETIADSGGFSTSAKNPTWPKFTPSNGICCSLVTSAARNIVPSPPNTTATSNAGIDATSHLITPAISTSEIV